MEKCMQLGRLAMNPAAGSLAYNSSALTVCTMFVVWFCVQGFVRSTTKYWVRAEDVSVVKYHILQVRGHSTTQHDTLRGTACIQHSIAQHSTAHHFSLLSSAVAWSMIALHTRMLKLTLHLV
jgi:hypothetical protein